MKNLLILVLTAILSLGTVGCSKSNNTNSKNTSNSKEIIIKYPNTQWYDAVYIADSKGYFKEQGIKIKYVGEIPAAQIVPSVASGNSRPWGGIH